MMVAWLMILVGVQWMQSLWLPGERPGPSLNRSLTGHALFLEAPDTLSPGGVLKLMKEKPGAFTLLTKNNLGYVRSVYWIVIPFKGGEYQKSEVYLELQNPQVDRLQAYYYSVQGLQKLGPETGDVYPFRQRLYIHRNFVWPLPREAVNDFVVILRIDKKNSTLSIPLYIWDANAFRDNNTRHTIFYGIAFGMLILMAVYAVGAWIFLREPIYGWYLARIITGALLLMAAEGLAFQLVYPGLAEFNGYFRVFINGLQGVVIIRFTQLFLGTRNLVPRIHSFLELLFYVQLLLCISFPFMIGHYTAHSLFWLPFALTLTAAISFIRILAAVMTYRYQKKISLFYLTAYCMTLVAGLLLIAEDFGWIEKMQVNPLFGAVLLETFVLSLGLTYLVKKVYEERNDLALRMSRHQNEKMMAYIEGVEKERVRIAGELHDDIGSRLSNLRRIVESPHDEIERQIEIISNGVRGLSHQLAPPSIKSRGLRNILYDLVLDAQAGTTTKIDLQFFDVPDALPELTATQVFRIAQEVLNNSMKHSHASHVHIQLFGYEKEIVLSFEDNGRGFDPGQVSAGIGLKNVKARVEAMHGSYELVTAPHQGVQILIIIPLQTDGDLLDHRESAKFPRT